MKGELQSYIAILEQDPDNERALLALEAMEGKFEQNNGFSLDVAARALAGARRAHRERNDWDLVLRTLNLELSWTTDPARRADLFYERARVLLDELLVESQAVDSFQQVLELRPDDVPAQEALSNLELIRENWEPIAMRYRSEAEAAKDKQLATSLYLSAAELYLKHSSSLDEGEQLLEKALEADPRNRKAQLHLERRLRERKAFPELGKLLAKRAELAVGKADRSAALVALAELDEKMGETSARPERWRDVLAVDPAHPRALRAVVEVLTQEGDWKGLVKLYEAALKARPRGEMEAALILQIGLLYWKRLQDLESAEEYFRKVQKGAPAHSAVLEFYRAYYGARGEGAKLLGVLGQGAKAQADPQKRLDLLVEMARAAEADPTATEKAIDLWKAVLRADPKREEGAQALRKLYRKTEKWNALLELLKEEIEQVPLIEIDRKIALHLEIAEIYRDRLSLDVMVVGTYQNILGLKPDHEGALSALAAKYEAMGRWNDLIAVLQKRADGAKAVEDRVALLRRIAALWLEKFANANQSVKPLEEILALVPDDAPTIPLLRDIYTKRRSWRALLELDRRELPRLDGGERRARLAQMARLAAEKLGDAREAINLWNQVLELDPMDLQGVSTLAALYEREKRWPQVAEMLRRQAEQTENGQVRASLLERAGSLFLERLDAPAAAAVMYRQVLQLQPGHTKAQRTLRELYAQQGDFTELERLYAETGQWEELAETLLAVVDRAADTGAKLKLLSRIAEIYISELGQPERAVKSYERILSLDPGNMAAAHALVPIYQRTEKWARLVTIYELLLQHTAESTERLGLLREICTLCEQRLGSKGLAFQWCAKSYEVAPGDGKVVAALERLAEEAGAWEQLCQLYLRRAEGVAREDEKLALYRRLAQIAREKTGRQSDARKYWEEVASRERNDSEALVALEQIYTQQQAWPELAEIYARRADMESEPAKRIELGLRTAALQEERLVDLDAAAQAYFRVFELAKDAQARKEATRALGALERLYLAQQKWPELIAVLSERAGTLEEVEPKAALLIQQGMIYEEHLKEPARAFDAYREALAMAPGHRSAVAALERFVTDEGLGIDAVRLLAPLYERAEDSAKLAMALERQLGAELDLAEQVALRGRLVALYARKLATPDKAYGHAAEILTARPEDDDNRAALIALGETLERLEDVAARLQKAAGAIGDARLAGELVWQIADIYDAKLGAAAQAAIWYTKALDRSPDDERALGALERIYRQEEKWVELRGLLEDRAKSLLDPERRKDVLFQISELDEGVLDDLDHSIRIQRQILELDPGEARAYKALERVLAAKEQWSELDALLAEQLAHAPDPAAAASLRFRRAELHATKLSDLQGAVDLLEEVLSEQPSHEGARRVLERLMGKAELRQRIAGILEPAYERDESYAKLVAVLQARFEAAESTAAHDLLCRIATLQEEKLASRQAAFFTWREVLRLDPSRTEARENVERLGKMLERWNELAQAWEEAFALAPASDTALRSDYAERAARMYEGKLEDPARAQGAWRRLLDLDPHNPATARPAADALLGLYERGQAWTDLVAVLRLQLEWAESAGDRKQLLLRIARILEDKLADPGASVAVYRELAEQEPDDQTALDALERLYAAGSSYRDQIGVLRRRVELARNANDRRDLYHRIAHIQEQELGSAAEAIESYLALLDASPDDPGALGALARLYEAAGRWGDLREILVRELGLAEQTGAKLQLLARLAQLAEEKLGRLDLAMDRFCEILVLEPTNEKAIAGIERALGDEQLKFKAAEILEPIWKSRGDLAKQVALHELLAEAASDPAERISRLRQAAVLKEKLGDLSGAFDAYGAAVREALTEPGLGPMLDALERIAGEKRRHEDLAALYREIGPDVLDAALQQRIFLVVADLARTKFGDPTSACDYYRRVLDAAPDHVRALAALEALYLEGQQWEPLLEIYQRRVDLLSDPEEKRDYLTRAATLSDEKLARAGEAISLYEQVLELSPGDRDSMAALERLYIDGQRWADLADLLERRLGFAEDLDEAVALRFRLAGLYEERLRDPDRAVENYRAVLGGQPGHSESIARLERYLEDPTQQAAAAEVLEPVYAGRADWPKLVRIYEIRLIAAEEPKLRRQLIKRIARLCEEQLEDLDAAFKWYGEVFRLDPEDRASRDQLVRLAGILERWRELAEIYQGYLDDTLDRGAGTTQVCWMLASLYDDKIGDSERAKRCYERLLEENPGDAKVFEALERSLERAERFRELIELYEQAVSHETEMARRKALLFKICRIYEDNVGDAEQAIATYRQVLDADPDDVRAEGALDRLFVAQEKWHDLLELVTRKLERAEGETVLEIKHRLGTLLEGKLGDISAAIDAYEECLQRDGLFAPALQALERLILEKDYRLRIAQILEPLYRVQEEWAKLVVIYDAQLEFIEESSRRVEILQEIARIQETRCGNPRHAWEALAHALGEDPLDEATLAELERLTATLGGFPDLVKVLEGAAEGLLDPEGQARLYARVAELQTDPLKNPAAAMAAWRRVLTIREEDATALLALEKLLAGHAQWEELAKVIERRSDLADDPTERKTLLYRGAELVEQALGQRAQAIELWGRVLGIDENDPKALDALERLQEVQGDWRALAEVVARKIELAPPSERRPLQAKLARLYEDQLGDRYEAIGCYRAIRELDPNDREALAALDRLYESEKQWNELLEIIEARLGLESGPNVRTEFDFRAARLFEREVGDVETALERYARVLEAAPEHPGAREALFSLARAESTREAAAAVLDPYLRGRKEWERVVELLELRLESESDPARKRQLLAQLAEVHERSRGDAQAAFAAWGRALAEDAGDEQVQRELERLAAARSAFADLAHLYEERLANTFDADVGRALALKLATIYEEALGDAARAAAKLRAALEFPGEERAPLASLDRLLESLASWEELAEILEREVQASADPAEQAGFAYRLGLLRVEHFTDHEGAISAWADVLEREPTHEGAAEAIARYLEDVTYREQAIEILEPVFEAQSNWKNLLRVVEVKVLLCEEPLERARHLEHIAELAEKKLGDAGAALDAYGRALVADPNESKYVDELVRLGEQLGKPALAAERIEAVALGAEGSSTGVVRDLGLRAATLWVERAGQDERAEKCLRKVLESDPECADALGLLDRIYRGRGDTAALIEVLRRRAELESDGRRRQAYLAEAAQLAESGLGDTAAAIEAWRAALEADEANEQALAELCRLHEKGGQWAELASMLERAAEQTSDAQRRAGLYARAGAVYAERLHDLDHAAEAYRAALDAKAGNMEVLAALEAIHTERQDWLAVQEVLTQQLAQARAPAEQVGLYVKLARLAEERQGSVEEAIGFWTQAHDADPENVTVLEELERRLGAGEKWYELADILSKHGQLLATRGDKAGELGKLLEVAEVWERRLGNGEAAIEILDKVLERDPKNVLALTQTARLHEAAGDWDKCAAALERAAALGPTGRAAAELHFRLGRVEAERTGDSAKAEICWTRALEFDPTHAEALEALEKVARNRADWKRVVELLALRERALPEGPSKLQVLTELGLLWRDQLAQPTEAVRYLERAAVLAPKDARVVEPLADAYFTAGKLKEAAGHYQTLLDQLKAKRTKEAARYQSRLGAITQQLGDTAKATEYYNAAFAIDPTHGGTLAALGRLYVQQSDWEHARKVFRSMLLQNLDADAKMTKADVYLELGRIHARQGESPKARNMYERGLELDPAHEGLKSALGQLAQ